MPLAVVILNFDRLPNLRFVLRSLEEQTLERSAFRVIVADDGSTDGSVELIRSLMEQPAWADRLHLVSGGPHQGARITRLHNIGVANIPSECDFFVLLASDMCLAPDALEQFSQLHQQHPDAVILSRLDWLPPLSHQQIDDTWNQKGFAGLYPLVPNRPLHFVEDTLVGTETRPIRKTPTSEPFTTHPFHPIYGMPTSLYWKIGGYDESLSGYGWGELTLALRIEALGNVQMVTTQTIRGLHIWHPKNRDSAGRAGWERQRNAAILNRRLGGHPDVLAFRDWRYWRHYHREFGGTVACTFEPDPVLWAINESRTHRLLLPHPGWLVPLGYSSGDIEFSEKNTLSNIDIAGTAFDPLGECDVAALAVDLNLLLSQRIEQMRHPHVRGLLSARQDNPRLREILNQYDRVRTRSDRYRISRLPVVGVVVRVMLRVLWTGQLWAAEHALLKALVESHSAD